MNKLRDEGKFQIDLSARVLDFVQKLESGARFRYYETSYFSEYVELLQLDKAVWEIRRYCQPMDYDLEVDGRKVNQLAMNLERVRTARLAEERGTCITGGWLEQVIAKPTHEAREALLWKNLFFGHSRGKSVKLQTFEEAGNSPLFLYPEIVDEVAKYVYLPEEVKVAYRELYAQRLAGEA